MKVIVMLSAFLLPVFAQAPSELTGTWLLRKGSGTSYVNQNTGQINGTNATVHSYTFRADGRFEYAMLMQSALYNCTSSITAYETGEYKMEPSGIRMITQQATKGFNDSCRPSLNERTPAEVRAPETLRWRTYKDQDGAHLCMARAGGNESCFLRK